MFATILTLAASLLVALPAQPATTASASSADQSADLTVDFSVRPALVFNGANFDIKVSNFGPDALESATVVLTVDLPFHSNGAPAGCVADDAQGTFTCPFGPMPANSRATVSSAAYFTNIHPGSGFFTTTATITASTPPDPVPNHTSVTKNCSYNFQPMPPSPPWWVVGCNVSG